MLADVIDCIFIWALRIGVLLFLFLAAYNIFYIIWCDTVPPMIIPKITLILPIGVIFLMLIYILLRE